MARLPENLPTLEVGVTIIAQKRTGTSLARVWVLNREDTHTVLWRSEFPSGRPTPGDVEDLLAALTSHLSDLLVTQLGIQGVTGA